MLNIPEEVKALLKTDSAFKNFVVHFPNGENTDLNNDDILTESVTFTESLCSQETFRFGLTEASEIKFTAINIPNIRGVTLECALDISIDRMEDPAQFITDHTPTGNEAFLEPHLVTLTCQYLSDLSGYAYRIPLGRFIVDSCPRNHESMAKREVTAYTERVQNTFTNHFQTALMRSFFIGKPSWSVIPRRLAYSLINNPDALSSAGFEELPSTVTTATRTRSVPVYLVGSTQTVNINLTYTYNLYKYNSSIVTYAQRRRTITAIDWNDYEVRERYDDVALYVRLLPNIDYERSGYADYNELATALFQYRFTDDDGRDFGAKIFKGYPAYARITYEFPIEQTTSLASNYIDIPTGTRTIYFNQDDLTYIPEIYAVTYVTLSAPDIQSGTMSFPYRGTPPTVTNWVDPVTDEKTIQYNSTLETTYYASYYATLVQAYSFTNAVSLTDVLQGYLELSCCFGSPARTGGTEVTTLDNTTPVSLPPSDYSSLWYDETVISPVGYAMVKFKDEDDNEQDITVNIGDGESIYDLTANAVINNTVFTVTDAEAEAGITIESKIIDYLTEVFTPNIPDMSFVPIELSKKGLPYLEAGDALTITTYDAQTVPSFILRHTITGIQFLQAEVESANGEAMEIIET